MSWNHVEFSVINARIKEKIPDPSIVKGEMFSYLKLFQHGLSYAITGATNKKTNNPFISPFYFIWIKYFITSLLRKNSFPKFHCQSIVVLDGGRSMIENGQTLSIIFEKIISAIGRKKLTRIDTSGKFISVSDVHFPLHFVVRSPLNSIEKNIWKDLQSVYQRLCHTGNFSDEEQQYIGAAFHIFFESFRKYYRLLCNQSVKQLFFSTHYHQEGLLAACRILGIQTVEAQHGIIAKRDIYYVYEDHWKEVLCNALFPDRILVFGKYWKDILTAGNEFSPDQILIPGDYIYRKKVVSHTAPPEKIILVASQKNMHETYIPYIQFLSALLQEKHNDWRMIVKFHPFESKAEQYQKALHADNITWVRNEQPIDELLAISRIQISIYSTTLFEGLGTSCTGMILLAEGHGSDYARDLVEQGIAHGIQPDDDPIAVLEELQHQPQHCFSKNEVYAPFDEQVITSCFSPTY